MSQGPTWSIQYGFWNNHDYGSVLGTTLTATNNYGFLLISCVTIFISFLGGEIWQMICFCLHQLRATHKDKDGLHHQIQAVLRNSQSASGTMVEFIKMARAWNGHTKGPIRRLLPWIMLAGLESAAFTLAGIFANNIVGISHVVLLRSDVCGYAEYPSESENFTEQDWEKLDASFHEQRVSLMSALDYVRSCYSTDMVKTGICEAYAVPSLSSTFQNVNCPFDESICLDPSDQGSYQFSSGVINSNFHLGINAPPAYSVNYERMTTCSPLQTQGYNETSPDQDITQDQFLTFYYGGMPLPWNTSYTWFYHTLAPNFTNSPFAVDTRTYYNGGSASANDSSTFIPISELNQTNGDITLIFLANNALYTAPVYDPWYLAQIEQPDNEYYFGGHVWVAENPVSVMGCTELHRWCNPAVGNGTEQCSDWSPWASLSQFDSLSTEQQPVATELLNSAIATTNVGSVIEELSTDSLNAWLNVGSGHTLITSQLPPNQWMLDVQNWMNITLAQFQRSVVSVVTGPSTPAFNQYIIPPPQSLSQVFDVCQAQKVQDQRFYSFNVCWLIVLFTVGTFIIFCNMFLPDITGWLRTRFDLDEEKKEDWDKDHLLQIQRIAYETNNLGKWRSSKRPDSDSAVPITSSGSYGAYGEVFGKPNRKSSHDALGMQLKSRHGFKARQSDENVMRHSNSGGMTQRIARFSDNVSSSVLDGDLTASPPTGEAHWDQDSPPQPRYAGFPFPNMGRVASGGSADFDSDTRALLSHHSSGDSGGGRTFGGPVAAAADLRSKANRDSLISAHQSRYSPNAGSSFGGRDVGGDSSDGFMRVLDSSRADTRYMRVVHEEADEFESRLHQPDGGDANNGGHGPAGAAHMPSNVVPNDHSLAAMATPDAEYNARRVDDEDITHMGIMR